MTDNSSNLRELVFDLSLQSAVATQLHSQDSLPFIRSVIRQFYDVSADGQIVPNDQAPLTFDNRPMEIEQIAEYLRHKHAYLFKEESASSSSVQAPAPKPVQKSRAEMSISERCDFIRRYGNDAYFDLPADPVAAIPVEQKKRSEMTLEERCAIIHERGSTFYEALPE